jgi:PAS domain S-box-containing protein
MVVVAVVGALALLVEPEGGSGVVTVLVVASIVAAVGYEVVRRSARRQAEAAAEYRRMFELAGIGQAQADPETGRLARVNPKLAEITGYTAQELLHKTYLDLTHPDDRDAARQRFERLVSGLVEDYGHEQRLVRRDGESAWVDVTATMVRDPAGGPPCVLVAVHDVTRRKEGESERDALLEDARKARAEALRRVQESERLAAVNHELAKSLRLETVAQAMCRAARDLTGADGATFVVREGDEVVYVEEDAIAPLWKGERFPAGQCISGWAVERRAPVIVEDVFAEPRAPQEAYARTFVHAVAMVPILRSEPQAALGAYWSRPYRPSAHEMALLEALADAAAIALRNAALYAEAEAARRDAEAASRAKDEFIAVVSHELRSPLSAIRMWTTLLRQREPSREQMQHGLSVIERNVEAQVQLVSDLLDVSRILSGKLHVDLQATDIAAVVHAAIDAVRPAALAKNVHIEEPSDVVVHPVWGDPGRLQQVAWNVLSNAVKFTPPGGRVSVRIERKTSRFVRLVVSDTGEGIPPSMLPHIFERFRQADPTSTRQHGGLGLGLAIARHLVDLHGGRIDAESDGGGQGATFTVTLPVDARPESMAALRHGADGMAVPRDLLGGMRVLVVDDDEDARHSLAAILQAHGADTTAAGSVAEALMLARRTPPDVVVSDIAMPQVDGYALPKQLRLVLDRGVPAIALTAFAAPTDRDRALVAGFRAHVPKPVNPETLLALVARLGREDDSP